MPLRILSSPTPMTMRVSWSRGRRPGALERVAATLLTTSRAVPRVCLESVRAALATTTRCAIVQVRFARTNLRRGCKQSKELEGLYVVKSEFKETRVRLWNFVRPISL